MSSIASVIACIALALSLNVAAHVTTESQNDVPMLRSLTDHELRMSEEAGHSYVDRLAQLEEELLRQGQYVQSESPFYSMARFKRANPEARELGQKALRMLEATRYLSNELGESGLSLRDTTSTFTVINSTCLTATTCTSSSKYRALNGTCNNLLIPNLGASNTDYRRLTTPAYSDGIESPRLASDGSALPNARLISTTVSGDADKPLTSATLALMQFGQFINHDMELTPQFTYSNGTDISCCSSSGGTLDSSQLYPACLPISIPTDDKFFNSPTFVRDCMNFVRTIAGPRLDCSLGYADQLNSNTHWLDASTVYGSSDSTMGTVRSYTGGLLLMTYDSTNKRYLLPQTSTCTTSPCFYCGDSRCTEQPQLAVMHTLWAREHNRIASKLSSLNPTWSDESVFQETRRIVIAEIQHITYNEFLPNILNSTTVSQYSLAPLSSGFFTNYSSSLTSGPISNEFATAAFRMGHSMVQGVVQLYNSAGSQSSSFNMSLYFNNAGFITSDATFLDSAIRGLLTQTSQTVDNLVSRELWNSLFRNSTYKFAFDIVALNIQRGRDHGLPGYNTYRQLCGFSKLTSFSGLTGSGTSQPTFPKGVAAFLTSVYSSVDDIDLYIAGITENPVSGGLLGPTLSCLIGENFNKLKYGDRFFYELGGQPGSFSSAQLTEIRKASLARIFCDNSDGTITTIQPQAFLAASGTNAAVSCSSIASLDLTQWQGESLP